MHFSSKSGRALETRQPRSLVLLCTLIVIVVSAACYFTYWKGAEALRERGEWQFGYKLETLCSESEDTLSEWISELELWAKQPSMIRILDQDVDNEIGESLSAAAQRSEHLRALACFDTEGHGIAFARSRESSSHHAPLDEEIQKRYLQGQRGEVRLTDDAISLRVPVFLEFGERRVIGSLEALLDARALLPRDPLVWVALKEASGNTVAERTPVPHSQFQEGDVVDLESDDWIRGTIALSLPTAVAGPHLWMDLAEHRESLFGQIPVLGKLVIAISAGTSLLLLSMLVAFYAQEQKLMKRLEERADRLEELNSALKRSRIALRDETMRAEAANRAKSDFLARMSHEIRTPMNGVVGASSILAKMELTDKQQELAGIIGSSGELLLAIINDILDFSKIEAGKLELEAVPFELWSLVDSTVGLAASGLQENVELSCFLRNDVPWVVEGDPIRLRQILVNLIGNAVKFTERGEIRVDVRLEQVLDSEVALRFDVSDTGQGIPAREITRIFESFTQAGRSTEEEHGGTGLGLAISKRLVEAMGGHILVTSEVGLGSTFTFTTRLGIAKGEKPARAARLSALLVTPSPITVEIFTHHLTSLGSEVTTLANAAEGEARLRSREASAYDLLVIDRDLDNSHAIELIRLAAGLSRTGQTHTIVLQGLEHTLEPGEREQLGVEVMTKPLRASELLRTLAGMESQAPTTEEKRLTPPSSLPRPRVLLAEDRLANQRVATIMLQQLGCDVDVVAHGRAAVEAAAHSHYDLILMDCLMPVMDGLEATRRIRKQEHERSVIIALTASALPSDHERCNAAGMDDFLAKPVRTEDLDSVLQRWIRPNAGE